ncbi:MAG TPA: energy transducer TonB [Terracidiphilus sp.]|jgi:TonB family protein|nr:energy transducer TonB [Terracidiphilus sp.]
MASLTQPKDMQLLIARAILSAIFICGVCACSSAQQAAGTQAIEQVATPQHAGTEQGVTQPILIPMPQLPLSNKTCKEKEERDESVEFSFYVDKEGRAEEIGFLRGLGNGLDQVAADLVKADRFKPGMFAGQPASVWQIDTITFRACGKRNKDSDESIVGEGWMTSQPVQTLGPFTAPDLVRESSDKPLQQVYRIGGGVTPPVPTFTPEAHYSREAREDKINGVCLVSIIIDTNGRPQQIRVVRPLGHGLDEQAIAAVKQYRFKPAMRDGKIPVPVAIAIEVNFRLY